MAKTYKAIWVSEKLQRDIKSRAAKKGVSIIEYLADLLKKHNL